MIMPRGQQLLLPVNPLFIVVTLVIGLAVNMLPLGRIVWLPDMLLLLLAFWSLNQPQRVGLGIAFVLGLIMDVDRASLLGQHALAYTLLVFVTGWMSLRLLWFSSPVQALHLLPVPRGKCEQAAGGFHRAGGHGNDAFKEEGKPLFPIAVQAHGLQQFVIAAAVLLEIQRQIQQRLLQHTLLMQQEHDQQAGQQRDDGRQVAPPAQPPAQPLVGLVEHDQHEAARCSRFNSGALTPPAA